MMIVTAAAPTHTTTAMITVFELPLLLDAPASGDSTHEPLMGLTVNWYPAGMSPLQTVHAAEVHWEQLGPYAWVQGVQMVFCEITLLHGRLAKANAGHCRQGWQTVFTVVLHGTAMVCPTPHPEHVAHCRSEAAAHGVATYEDDGQGPVEHGAQTLTFKTGSVVR